MYAGENSVNNTSRDYMQISQSSKALRLSNFHSHDLDLECYDNAGICLYHVPGV